MKLIRARIQNFRSIEDTGAFDIDDLTCLVGKNEAGKTAILDALYGLRPYRKFGYDKTRDYPRRFLTKFDERHPDGESEVARTWWQLDDQDIEALEEVLGKGVLKNPVVEVVSGIGFDGTHWAVSIDEAKVVELAIEEVRPNAAEKAQITGTKTTSEFLAKVKAVPAPSPKLIELLDRFGKFRDGRATLQAIDILTKRMPKFFLTSHFSRMSGEVSLTQLARHREQGTITDGDQIFLDFIEYAGTSIEELQQTKKYEDLVAKCEAASNDITDEMLDFWSQNDALSVKIDIGEGKPSDPAPFNSGTIVKIRIYNENHRASVPLSERSAGFVWFFSFLSQFKQLSKTAGNVILLLDEPGLTLHGKAQADLLRYIKERLLEDHQVLFTTHSPFLVPANQLANVRVVEDVVEYPTDRRGKPNILGTKVTSEVLSVDGDTLFPLRSHLGYEITQSLFIGENTLLVEGPGDILFLQAASHALRKRGRKGLDERWTVCPSGGIDKIQSFASLFSGNRLNIAVLTDYGDGDKKKVERLRQSQILKSSQMFTTTEFTELDESDVEDFFAPSVYANLLNLTFDVQPADSIDPQKLQAAAPTVRVVKQAEALFRTMPQLRNFDHFSPAAYLIRHIELLDGESPDVLVTLNRFQTFFDKVNSLIG
jgi:predicted ATP-dependent endonuclease of OLD family